MDDKKSQTLFALELILQLFQSPIESSIQSTWDLHEDESLLEQSLCVVEKASTSPGSAKLRTADALIVNSNSIPNCEWVLTSQIITSSRSHRFRRLALINFHKSG